MTGIFVAFKRMMMMKKRNEWWWQIEQHRRQLTLAVFSGMRRGPRRIFRGFHPTHRFRLKFLTKLSFPVFTKDFPQFSFRLVSPEADLGSSAFLDKNILWLNFKLALTIRIVRDACCIIRSKNVFKRILFRDVFVKFRITRIGFVLSRQN